MINKEEVINWIVDHPEYKKEIEDALTIASIYEMKIGESRVTLIGVVTRVTASKIRVQKSAILSQQNYNLWANNIRPILAKYDIYLLD